MFSLTWLIVPLSRYICNFLKEFTATQEIFFLCKQTWKALNLPQNGDIVNILGDAVTFDNLLAVSFFRHVSKNAKDAVVWWIQKLGYGDSRLVFPSIVFGRQHLRSSKLELEHLSKRVSEWQIVDDALFIQRLDFAAQGAFSSLLRLIFQVYLEILVAVLSDRFIQEVNGIFLNARLVEACVFAGLEESKNGVMDRARFDVSEFSAIFRRKKRYSTRFLHLCRYRRRYEQDFCDQAVTGPHGIKNRRSRETCTQKRNNKMFLNVYFVQTYNSRIELFEEFRQRIAISITKNPLLLKRKKKFLIEFFWVIVKKHLKLDYDFFVSIVTVTRHFSVH